MNSSVTVAAGLFSVVAAGVVAEAVVDAVSLEEGLLAAGSLAVVFAGAGAGAGAGLELSGLAGSGSALFTPGISGVSELPVNQGAWSLCSSCAIASKYHDQSSCSCWAVFSGTTGSPDSA